MPRQSLRDRTTQEERSNMVIMKNNPNSTKSKMSEYLSRDNVKSFNRIVVSKSFEKLDEKNKKKSQQIFSDYDECKEEIESYFKLCDQYDIIPTIASMSLYLGVNRDTLYTIANNSKTYVCSDIVKTAIATCQAYHENAFMSGEVPPVAFIFYAKNYYNMKDQTDVRFNQDNQDNGITTQSIDALKQQIEHEKQQLLIESDNS